LKTNTNQKIFETNESKRTNTFLIKVIVAEFKIK